MMDEDAQCKDCGNNTTMYDRRFQMYRNDTYSHTICHDCYMRQKTVEYNKTGVLSSRLWLDLTLEHREQWDNPTIPFMVSMQKIKSAAADFGRDIWFRGGLQKFFRDSKYAAFSMGDDSGFKLLMMASAGRAMFTFYAPDEHSVTLITDESSDTARMGVQGIDATEEVALGLIARGVELWKSGVRPVVDSKVGF